MSETVVRDPYVKQSDLTKYNTRAKTWTNNKIGQAIANLGTIITIKGRVDTKDLLPDAETAKPGNVYLVGAADAVECEEYLYTEDGKWEFVGVTSPSLEGYVTETSLFKGADGNGTMDAPAEGTIMYSVVTETDTNTADIETIQNTLNETIADEEFDAMFTD